MKIEVIGTARGGSSYMGDMVKMLHQKKDANFAEPDFTEEFVERVEELPFATVKFLASKYRNHINSPHYQRYKDMGWYRICIVRTDLFHHSLSFAITKTIGPRINNNNTTPITIDPTVFDDAVHSRLEENLWLSPFIEECDELIRYEELYGVIEADMEQLEIVKNGLIKMPDTIDYTYNISPSKQDVVINYDEISRRFHDKFFKDSHLVMDWFKSHGHTK